MRKKHLILGSVANFGKGRSANKVANYTRGLLFPKVQVIPKKYDPLCHAEDGVLNFNKHGVGVIESA